MVLCLLGVSIPIKQMQNQVFKRVTQSHEEVCTHV